MSKKEKFESRMLTLLMLLCVMTLCSFWMLGNLYARYTTQSEGDDSARVAVFAIEDRTDLKETYVIHPSMTGDQAQQIEIQVKNSSEVAVRYTFSFEIAGNLPLIITAKAPEGAVLQKDATVENCWSIEKAAGQKWDESYQFVLSLDNTKENYQYAGGVESIQLAVTAKQID